MLAVPAERLRAPETEIRRITTVQSGLYSASLSPPRHSETARLKDEWTRGLSLPAFQHARGVASTPMLRRAWLCYAWSHYHISRSLSGGVSRLHHFQCWMV